MHRNASNSRGRSTVRILICAITFPTMAVASQRRAVIYGWVGGRRRHACAARVQAPNEHVGLRQMCRCLGASVFKCVGM